MFDCVRVNFPRSDNKEFWYNREILFVENYLTILRSIAKDIKTSHFWLVASFVDASTFDFNYMPEQFENNQIHCWYDNDNKEGNILLVPRDCFIEQMD
jgi:hypothetical protein